MYFNFTIVRCSHNQIYFMYLNKRKRHHTSSNYFQIFLNTSNLLFRSLQKKVVTSSGAIAVIQIGFLLTLANIR